MKISSVGIILLTLMVSAKYFISLNSMTHKDGTLGEALAIDYAAIQKELLFNSESATRSDLLAANYHTLAAPQLNGTTDSRSFTTTESRTESVSGDDYVVTEMEELEGPAPMEYANTLVVYNPSNPVITQMSTRFDDPEDSEPLDQGNTLINEMQLMMPRR